MASDMRMPRRVSDPVLSAFRRAIALARSERVRGGEDGQTLVEFAMVFPLIMILLMSIIEFSLAFNAVLGVDRASENGVLVASEDGNNLGADCLVLQEIDNKLTAPNDDANVTQVQIQRTNASGVTILAANIWTRGGSTPCTFADNTPPFSVPYTATSLGYPENQRCAMLTGCSALSPARSTVDTIGVQVRYTYTWKTPLSSLLTMIGGDGSGGAGWTFNKRNVMRIEPVL
jgi:Flp pilus assembly protein TadG